MDYLRFPKTPHLMWLGVGAPRDDKVISPEDAAELLLHVLVVEEKIDGANIGISLGDRDELRVQNRGAFLAWDSLHPQFKPLPRWIETHRRVLTDALRPELILFGEWCYAMHSVHYTRLPDWFIAFDIYDRAFGKFWSVERRDAFTDQVGLATAPRVARGKFEAEGMKELIGRSRFADGPAEGIYVRWDRGEFLERRAKLVQPEFTQSISEHWSRGPLRLNRLLVTGQEMRAR
ncbi:MAG: RNA ligase family protein [Vicinamibacterales bacterium]